MKPGPASAAAGFNHSQSMKHYTIATLAALSLLIPTSLALAQEGEKRGFLDAPVKALRGVKDRIEVKGQFEARVDARKGSSTASSTARKVELQENIVKRMKEKAEKVMQAAIERLERLATRLESRIAKVKAEGAVVTDSERFLAEARTHISAAKAELVVFSSVTLSADRLSDNVEALRTEAGKVKEHLKLAHSSLVKAIRALKPGRSIDAKATSTATTTTP